MEVSCLALHTQSVKTPAIPPVLKVRLPLYGFTHTTYEIMMSV